MSNQRRFSRIQFDSPAEVIIDGQRFTGNIVDISLKGALMAFSLPADDSIKGKRGELVIGGEDDEMHIRMSVHCVHIAEELVGLESITIDIDSAGHLRRLIEVNLGSEALLNREMAALVEAYIGH